MDPIVKNKEEAWEEWRTPGILLTPSRSYEGVPEGEEEAADLKYAYAAGWDDCEQNAIRVLHSIREAVGDPEGKLTQKELVERVRGITEAAGEAMMYVGCPPNMPEFYYKLEKNGIEPIG